MRSGKHTDMIWNVTYNDAQRWEQVHLIAGKRIPWAQSITDSIRGRTVGSPKLDLVGVEGLKELERLRLSLNHRTSVNFQRTTEGVIAYTKVRLEVYAVPIRFPEIISVDVDYADAAQSRLVLHFQRDEETVKLTMTGASRVLDRTLEWFKMASNPEGA